MHGPTTPPERRSETLSRVHALKMAGSVHAYVRGNTLQFYEWLAASSVTPRIPEGPAIWICGDCHLGNLGPVADPEGRVDIEIRDLDQTVIGNPAHDLIRLALSLASAARGSDLPGVTTANMLEEMLHGYRMALGRPSESNEPPEPACVRLVKKHALGQNWKRLARERIRDPAPKIPLGKRFWPLTDEERREIEQLVTALPTRERLLAGRESASNGFSLLDAAYWVKGCSSLGKLRYAAVVDAAGADRSPPFFLIDFKEAVPPVAPSARGARMPNDDAERVRAGALALSPNLGDRIAAGAILGRPVFLRELKPQDLKIEIEQFTCSQAVIAAKYLAFAVGRAHARQLARDERRAWMRELDGNRRSGLEAPHWLWSSVVELAARHELGYLEYCRAFELNRRAA